MIKAYFTTTGATHTSREDAASPNFTLNRNKTYIKIEHGWLISHQYWKNTA